MGARASDGRCRPRLSDPAPCHAASYVLADLQPRHSEEAGKTTKALPADAPQRSWRAVGYLTPAGKHSLNSEVFQEELVR